MSKFLRGVLLGATLLTAPGLALAKTSAPQARFDSFAQTLGYHVTVVSNKASDGCAKPSSCLRMDLSLILPKTLPAEVTSGDFAIYTSFVVGLEPLKNDSFDMKWINGDLVKFTPKPGVVLKPGATYTLTLISTGHAYSPFFVMPNAYAVAGKLKPRVIAASRTGVDPSSGEETLPFVTPFTDESALASRDPADTTGWLTPERLYDQTAQRNSTAAAPEFVILPTPVKAVHLGGKALDLGKGIHVKLNGVSAADLKAARSALKASGVTNAATGVPVSIVVTAGKPESYHIVARDGGIAITAADAAGASYALRSLAQQAAFEHGKLKPLDIEDAPRFAFRGLHLDVARNFHSKAQILAVIEQMGAYKLNKLHLHLGDDEGWRLAIRDLPELTDIGSKRCHDPAENSCLLPELGAGPDANAPVNGYLTRADYIDILKAAKARQIEVIPSFDMPGHSRAAVRSMEARARRLIAEGKPAEAAKYRLVDPNDKTVYSSIQSYTDNTLDVCLDSTYAFIDKVMEDIKSMHDEAGLPLRIYHLGLDETAGAWTQSPACQKQLAAGVTTTQLGAGFVTRVSKILGDRGIEPAGWSDGMGSVDPAQMPKKVQSNSWGGLFAGGIADAYRQANQGWDVVMSTPEVLYLDMPQAADGYERGYDWASRNTDLYKVFTFVPENLGANAAVMTDYSGKGHTIADTTPLTGGHGITGMQGQLWSETTRSAQVADYMLFPRTLAVAERAWHKADWEPQYVAGKAYSFEDGSVDKTKLLADWQGFQARLVPQLAALDRAGISYRMPIPGARISAGKLSANSPITGLLIQYRLEKGPWLNYKEPVSVTGDVRLRTVSPDGRRHSREIRVRAH